MELEDIKVWETPIKTEAEYWERHHYFMALLKDVHNHIRRNLFKLKFEVKDIDLFHTTLKNMYLSHVINKKQYDELIKDFNKRVASKMNYQEDIKEKLVLAKNKYGRKIGFFK